MHPNLLHMSDYLSCIHLLMHYLIDYACTHIHIHTWPHNALNLQSLSYVCSYSKFKSALDGLSLLWPSLGGHKESLIVCTCSVCTVMTLYLLSGKYISETHSGFVVHRDGCPIPVPLFAHACKLHSQSLIGERQLRELHSVKNELLLRLRLPTSHCERYSLRSSWYAG